MATLVELCAFACFVVAGWLVSPVLGLAVAGAALLLISQAMEGAKVKLPKVDVPRLKALKAKLPRVVIVRPGHQPETARP